MLDPRATNRMTCTICGWTRMPIDHTREYRGGHTPPGKEDTHPDCHGMLMYEEVDPAPPEIAVPAIGDLLELANDTPNGD